MRAALTIITTTTFNLRPGAGSLTTRPASHRGDAPRREIQRPRTIRLHHHTTVQRFNPGVDKLWICLWTQSFFQATTNWLDRDDGRGLSKTAPAERLFIFSTSDFILSIPVSKDWPLKNINYCPHFVKIIDNLKPNIMHVSSDDVDTCREWFPTLDLSSSVPFDSLPSCLCLHCPPYHT